MSAVKSRKGTKASAPAGKTLTPESGKSAGAGFSLRAYFDQVAALARKISWPSRRSSLMTTGAVVAMVTLACVFFLGVDQLIGLGLHALFTMGD